MSRGGKRSGAGRKKGVKNRKRLVEILPVKVSAKKLALVPDQTPLEYMLAVMRDRTAEYKRRDEMAKAAAPFCHERLAPKAGGKKAQEEEDARTAGAGSDWDDDFATIGPVN